MATISQKDQNYFELQVPAFYYRQHEHDISKPTELKTALDQCKRVALVALPFVGLYGPLSKPLALAGDGLRGVSSLVSLITNYQSENKSQIAAEVLTIAISVASIAGTLFAGPLGMLIATGHDLVLDSAHLIHALNEKDYKKAGELCGQIVASSLYLGMFFSGALELSILATSAQVFMGIYRSADQWKKGNYLEAGSHMLMTAIRSRHLSQQVAMCKSINSIKKFAPGTITAAYKVEMGQGNDGVVGHFGYYQDGTVIATVVNNPADQSKVGTQGVFAGTVLKAATAFYTMETINGVTYVRHWYPDGAVYSTENSQYVVTY